MSSTFLPIKKVTDSHRRLDGISKGLGGIQANCRTSLETFQRFPDRGGNCRLSPIDRKSIRFGRNESKPRSVTQLLLRHRMHIAGSNELQPMPCDPGTFGKAIRPNASDRNLAYMTTASFRPARRHSSTASSWPDFAPTARGTTGRTISE